MRRAVVLDVALGIDCERHPQAKGYEADQGIDSWNAGGMAVNDLMLQRPVETKQIAAEGCQNPPWQRGSVPSE